MNISEDFAKDLIVLVNSLKGLPKSSTVDYSVQKKDGSWIKKSFKYTPLDLILEKIKENENFALIQPIGVYDGILGVKNILIHKNGEVLESAIYPINSKKKVQDEGAEITYKKRYSLGAFLGIATDEDTDCSDPEATPKKKVDNDKASARQIETLLQNYQGENLTKLLNLNGIEKIEDITKKKASELIKKILEKKEAQNVTEN